jgi:hypothetical protein
MSNRGYTIKSSKSEIEIIKEKYDEETDNKLEEKYIREIVDNYKYSIKEMNEKIIILNEETKKVITDTIMENTIYNIICEAVYGEMDLTEKQRIYFFLDKNTNEIINGNNNIKPEEDKKNENKKSENMKPVFNFGEDEK